MQALSITTFSWTPNENKIYDKAKQKAQKIQEKNEYLYQLLNKSANRS